jgi:flagellar biosynthesis chaperone FliJ
MLKKKDDIMDMLRARWAPRKAKRQEWKKLMDIKQELRQRPAVLMNTSLAETEKDIFARKRERG